MQGDWSDYRRMAVSVGRDEDESVNFWQFYSQSRGAYEASRHVLSDNDLLLTYSREDAADDERRKWCMICENKSVNIDLRE